MRSSMRLLPGLFVSFLLLAGDAPGALASAQDCLEKAEFFSVQEVQACFNELAERTGDWRDCQQAPAPAVCILNLAVEERDPTPIFEATEAPEHLALASYSAQRDIFLVGYAVGTGDPAPLEMIQDNEVYDQGLTYFAMIIYGRIGYPPVEDYCGLMRGDYEYDSGGIWAPGEGEIFHRNFCERVVAAVRQKKYNDDSCERLPERIQVFLNESVKENATAKCLEFMENFDDEFEKMSEAFGGIEEKWVLVDIRTNPAEAPTEFIAGVTPGFYNRGYQGSRLNFTVEENLLAVDTKMQNRNTPWWDARFQAKLDAPRELIPGEEAVFQAHISGSGQGYDRFANSCSAGLHLEFTSRGIQLQGERSHKICLDLKGKTLRPLTEVPPVREGQLSVSVGLYNCRACKVTWVYEKNKLRILEAQVSYADADLSKLAPHFDIPEELQ